MMFFKDHKVPTTVHKSKVAVVIRVYNRIDDLAVCVDSIKKYWNSCEYFIIVVSNGKTNGFEIPETIKLAVDCVLNLKDNAGHLKGNSQLLLAGIEQIPEDCHYTVILEADTWIFSDKVINKYIKKLESTASVWASSEWVKKYWSLGVDFTIIKSSFITSNKAIFDFGRNPEAYVCNYLLDTNNSFIYIKENMPVHVPKCMRSFISHFGGRFRNFPHSKMVTHHIEELQNGMNTKKQLANYCAGEKIFPMESIFLIMFRFIILALLRFAAIIAPQSSWIRKKKRVVET